ncbi:VWA domain-containing protein [Vibrio superstes NBRC 103154]|uniref:VWA domain-containing protein n=2 Tax=Vibrio superstes TaxID=198815 RepID=A0A511QNZ1_9VIBR|nr:VWA domain-containing protein [Vibrio superstes NBRC 103154]
MSGLSFDSIWALLMLPLPLLVLRFAPAHNTYLPALRVPFYTELVRHLGLEVGSGAARIQPTRWQRVSISISWVLLVLAAAKPVMLDEPQTRELEGRNLLVVTDISGSMSTLDFTDAEGERISRWQAAIEVLEEFSMNRKGDRLGLVVFGEFAYLQAPFTSDHEVWLSLLKELEIGQAGQGTHLGDAIGLGIKVFDSEAHSNQQKSDQQRVMIVLTDGNDTDSLVPPLEAAKVAKHKGVRIHIVAMGNPNTEGDDAMDMDIIRDMAQISGGRAFLAMSKQELNQVYAQISMLEPQLFDSFSYQPKTSLHYYLVLMVLMHHILMMSVYHIRQLRMKRFSKGVA